MLRKGSSRDSDSVHGEGASHRPACRPQRPGPRLRCGLPVLAVMLALGLSLPSAFSAGTEECEALLIRGEYQASLDMARQEIERNAREEDWRLLEVRALMATGRYPEAREAIVNTLSRFTTSVRAREAAYEVFRMNGQPERSQTLLKEIDYLAGSRGWAYVDAVNMVALGKTALRLGADPARVLETFYDRARTDKPDYRRTYIASGELALDKNDFQTAANAFREGLKKYPDDPDLHCGMARAFAPGDRREMQKHIEAALEGNPNHVGALLLVADHLIDAEAYDEARSTLERISRINPWRPEAWAYTAVLEHLAGHVKGEIRARENGLRFWKENPGVDHLIGRKLSQKYRFAEGAAYQKRALEFDPDDLPAKTQLAQDLLRLGDDEGWKLAAEVHEKDAYDVTAYNLVTLSETMAEFETLRDRDFIVRMSPHEASIYGRRVLALLHQAKQVLVDKYGLELDQPTIVEIFPRQGDFAVRTFGMPGGAGYLGVCFGRLITANSPASQAGSPSNWEAVLWHEFTHVITLSLTRNKMPRWLSEGISVHEELEASPVWGQTMNPTYREMILGGELTPIGDLSSAFLAPKSGMHLQFAYYESALVVEFIIGEYGLDALKRILHDLGEGTEINAAIARHTVPMEMLEKAFAAFAKARAEGLAPELDWSKPEPKKPGDFLAGAPDRLEFEAPPNPKNYYYLTQHAQRLLKDKKFEEAKEPLRTLIRHYPGNTEANDPYTLLAYAHRQLEESAEERKVLEELCRRSADAVDAFLRLMELAAEDGDWKTVLENGRRHLAVNPLLPAPYRHLARAQEELGMTDDAIESYRVMTRLEPADPAHVHYRLARLLHRKSEGGARRHLLQALEEAPRFRAAHKLLLEMHRATQPAAPPTKPAP